MNVVNLSHRIITETKPFIAFLFNFTFLVLLLMFLSNQDQASVFTVFYNTWKCLKGRCRISLWWNHLVTLVLKLSRGGWFHVVEMTVPAVEDARTLPHAMRYRLLTAPVGSIPVATQCFSGGFLRSCWHPGMGRWGAVRGSLKFPAEAIQSGVPQPGLHRESEPSEAQRKEPGPCRWGPGGF